MTTPACRLIKAFYETVDDPEQPASALDRFFADGFKDHNRPATAPADASDRTVALNLFAELRSGFPKARHTLDILEPLSAGRAMVYWTFTGTQTGPFFAKPASNRPVSVNGVDIFRVADGQFREQWHVEELMSLFGQIASGQP